MDTWKIVLEGSGPLKDAESVTKAFAAACREKGLEVGTVHVEYPAPAPVEVTPAAAPAPAVEISAEPKVTP